MGQVPPPSHVGSFSPNLTSHPPNTLLYSGSVFHWEWIRPRALPNAFVVLVGSLVLIPQQ